MNTLETFRHGSRGGRGARIGITILAAVIVALCCAAGSARAATTYVETADSPWGPSGAWYEVVDLAVDQDSGDLIGAQWFNPGFQPGSLLLADSSGAMQAPFGCSGALGWYTGLDLAADGRVFAYFPNSTCGFDDYEEGVVVYDAIGDSVQTVKFPVDPAYATGATTVPMIAVDADGQILIPSLINDRVDIYDPQADPKKVTSFAGSGAFTLTDPADVAIEADGSVLVADSGNDRVLRFDPDYEPANEPVVHAGPVSALAVDRSTGNYFVGGDDGFGFEISAYSAGGDLIATFGKGLIGSNLHSSHGIAVDEDSGRVYVPDHHTYTIRVFEPVEIEEPTVENLAASNVTQTSAVLRGKVDLHGAASTSCRFLWGLPGDLNQEAPCAETPAESGEQTVTAEVSSLQPETTYEFQLEVESAGGLSLGEPVAQFTTSAHTCTTDPSMPGCDDDAGGGDPPPGNGGDSPPPSGGDQPPPPVPPACDVEVQRAIQAAERTFKARTHRLAKARRALKRRAKVTKAGQRRVALATRRLKANGGARAKRQLVSARKRLQKSKVQLKRARRQVKHATGARRKAAVALRNTRRAC